MLVTPHAVAGATIGALVPSVEIAITVAVGSHFLLDAVPHWQETLAPYTPHRGTWVRVPVDLALATALTHWIARGSGNRAAIWRSALAGVLPDIDFLWFLIPNVSNRFGVFQGYVTWHAAIQHETARLWGLLPQIGVILGCAAALRSNPGRGGHPHDVAR